LPVVVPLLWFASCGVQAPPQPPRIEQPERIKDLQAVQMGRTIRLSFTLPRNATDGQRLTKPQEVEILRSVGASELKVWKTLSGDEASKLPPGELVVLPVPFDAEMYPPSTVRFAVRTVTRGFRNRAHASEISEEAELAVLSVLDAPQNLTASVTEKAIRLSWPPSAEPPTSYRVHRSPTGAPNTFRIIGEPVEPAFEDPDFVFGRRYFYRVSAVVKSGNTTALSEDSQIMEVVPRDTFAPRPPQSLTAVYTTDFVELIWNANSESDLGGYHVYRQTEGSGETRITSEPLSTPIYRDANVTPGKSYTYRVTAVDASGNESAFSEGAAAEAR
jgi:hypothetical protein